MVLLRLPDTYASEIAKICDLKTFWPLIQLINHLFKIRQKVVQKGFLSDFEKLLYWLNYKPERPEVVIFLLFLEHRCLVTLSVIVRKDTCT